MKRAITFLMIILFSFSISNAADRYWVGGAANTNWSENAGGNTNWGTASNTQDNALVPTEDDKVFFDANSGVGIAVIDVNVFVDSIDCTGFTGTLQHNTGFTLSVGDTGAPGASTSALKFVAGMTYTLGNSITSNIKFVSVLGTVQSVDFAGKTTGSVTFDGVGGSWQMTGEHKMGLAGYLTLTNGTFDTNGQAMTWGLFNSSNSNIRTLTMGSSIITLLGGVSSDFWKTTTVTNLTVTANTATVKFIKNSGSVAPLFHSVTKDWNGMSLEFIGGRIATMRGGNSIFFNLTVNGSSAVGEDRLQINESFTVTNTLNFYGSSIGKRLRVHSNGGVRTLTIAGATVNASNVNFYNISLTVATDLSGITGGAGDLGGNSNITFSAGIPLYWKTASTGTKLWSNGSNWYLANGNGAGRAPLGQDDVIFNADSIGAAGTIIEADSSTLGTNITWTGITNNPVWHFSNHSTILGSLTLDSGVSMTLSSSNRQLYFNCSGTGKTNTIFSDGVVIPHNFIGFYLGDNTNTLALSDDFSCSSTVHIKYTTIDTNDFNFSAKSIVPSTGSIINMGAGNWTVTGADTDAYWGFAWYQANGTLNGDTSTIIFSDQTSNQKTFRGNGRTFNNLKFTGSGLGNYRFYHSDFFNTISSDKTVPFSILIVGGKTVTVDDFTASGSADALVRIDSTNTTAHNLVSTGANITVDFVHVSNSAASGATWTAGANSVNGGDNTGWTFGADLPGLWINDGTGTDNWSDTANWAGGAVPGANDIVYFTKLKDFDCQINTPVNVKGIVLGSELTLTVTQADTITVGSVGLDIRSGIFAGSTQSITSTGRMLQIGGTFTSTNGTFQVTSQNGPTFNINGGTFIHNGSTVNIVGTSDADVSAPTGSPLNHLTINTTGTVSGKIYVANDLTRSAGNNLDANIYLSGDYKGAGGTAGGTGTIRFVGGGAQSFTNPNAPSVIVDTTGPLAIPADITVGGSWTQTGGTVTWNNFKATFNNVNDADVTITSGVFYDLELAKLATNDVTLSGNSTVANDLTITSLENLNGSNIEVTKNYSVAANTWTGTGKIVFSGTDNSSISGAGRQGVTTEINKTGGTVSLAADFDIYNSGHDLSVIAGGLSLSGFDLTVADTFTMNGTMSLKGNEVITVNSLTTSSDANANFTISATSSNIVYTDSAVNAVITDLAKTFFSLTLGASKTHEIATGAGNGITINGTLSSNGTSGTRSVFRSVANASATWQLTLNGSSALADKVDVKNSDASPNKGVLATGSVGRGTNLNWVGLINLPYATTILSSSNTGIYKEGDAISVQITFNESVTLAGGNLVITLNSGGTVMITPFTGTNASGTYTVSASQNVSVLNASSMALSAGTLKNGATNDVDLDLPTTNISSSKTIEIDTAAPTMSSNSLDSANAFIDIVFDSDVYNANSGSGALEVADFVLTFAANGGSATAVSISSVTTTTGTALTGGEKRIRLNLAITGSVSGVETIIVTPASTAIFDEAGNAALTSNTTGSVALIDQVLPVVLSVSATTSDGTYKKDDIIIIEVTFSESVVITGIPTLQLETGSTDQFVNFSSGSGTTKILFNYTIKNGDNSIDLDYLSTAALSLNGGFIKDSTGNSATLTLSAVGATNSLGANKSLVIDASLPTITSSALSANNAYMDIVFSEGVYSANGAGALQITDLSLTFTSNTGTVTDVSIASLLSTSDATLIGGESAVRVMLTVTGAVTGVESIRIQPASDRISDLAGNKMSGSNSTGEVLLLSSSSIPTVVNITSEATNATYDISDTILITMRFSEVIAVTGIPSITLETGGTDTVVSYISGSGSDTLTFEYVVSVDDISLDLEIKGTSSLNTNSGSVKSISGIAADLILPSAGETGSLSINKNIVVDTSDPVILSVTTSVADGNYTAGDVIPLKITFSRAVTLAGGEVKIGLKSGSIITITEINGDSVEANYVVVAEDTAGNLAVEEILLTTDATLKDSNDRSLVLALSADSIASLGSIEINADETTTITISGGGCQYSENASDESGIQWLMMFLIIFISVSFMKRKDQIQK